MDIDGRTWRWITKDGRKLSIGQIEPSHLANIIRYLESVVEKAEAAIASYYSFPPQGEMAAEYLEREVIETEDEVAYIELELVPWLKSKLNLKQSVRSS